MRSYVIDSKEQDISYIPLNSFVYHDGCGFIKRKQTTAVWNDTDFERIYCTSNDELNPNISAKGGVTLQDAETLRFIVSGAFDFEKGATITEIIFRDILGNPIAWNATNISDVTLSNATNWDHPTEWGMNNLFNNNTIYTDSSNGATSSTIFNLGIDNYDKESEFYITLPPEMMSVLDSIEIIAGSPEGRIPQSISIFAVFDKDIPETKRETLIFLKTFSSEVDGMRPAVSYRASQKVGAADPCYDLFMNGMNEDGAYLVLNPNTGLLEVIMCKFPEIFVALPKDDPGYTDSMNSLCSQDPRTNILIKDNLGEYTQISINDYFNQENWICEFAGCEGLSNTNYAICINEACKAGQRNDKTVVKYLDNNFNLVEINIIDYLASKNAVCADLKPIVNFTKSTEIDFVKIDISDAAYQLALKDGFVGTYDEWLRAQFEASLDAFKLSNLTAEEFENLFQQWLVAQQNFATAEAELVSNLDTIIENSGYGSDGFIELLDPVTGDLVTMLASEYKELILVEPEPRLSAVVNTTTANNSVDDTTVDKTTIIYVPDAVDNSSVKEPLNISIDLQNVANMDLNNIQVMDSLNAVVWHFEEEIIDKEQYDAFGTPIVDENGFIVTEPITKIKIIIDKINLPEGMNYGITELTISDGESTQTIKLEVKEDGLTIREFKNIIAPHTFKLKALDNTGYNLQKKFEWDEPGLAIEYFGAKGPMVVKNISNLFEVTITPNGRAGTIIIKSLLTINDITNLLKENIIITDGVREYNIELFVTSHMNIGTIDNKDTFYDGGHHIVDDGSFTIPVFNALGTPLVLNPAQKNSYYGNRTSGSLCTNYAATGKGIINIDSVDITDKYLIEITPTSQKLTGTTLYVLDPFFNYRNFKDKIIDYEDIKVIELHFTFDKLLVSTRYNFKIDKYRYYNSKTFFTYNYKCLDYDFKILHQAPGLNVEISNPNVVGISYGENCDNEDRHYICRHGGEAPKKFRLLTGEKFTTIGQTNIRIWDSISEININVETVQSLDIVLLWDKSTKYYTIPNSLVGGQVIVDLLHPWDNNWDLVTAFSMDETKCTTLIDKVNGKLIVNFHYIGETFIYVSDSYTTHKIYVSSSYGTVFTPEYTRFDILDNDSEWKIINLLNVQGVVSIGNYNSNIVNVELISNTQIRIKVESGVIGNTEIELIDTATTGITTASIYTRILDNLKYIPTAILINEDNTDVNTITNPDGSITYTHDVFIPDTGNWTVDTDALPEGLTAYIDENGFLKIYATIGGTYQIKLVHIDGTIKYITAYIPLIWNVDTTPIIFDNNDFNIDLGE